MAVNPRNNSGDAGRGRRRSMSPMQWGALIGGGALALYGITRRSPLGAVLAAGGGTLALFGSTRKSTQDQSAAWTSILINCTPDQAYRFWRDIENLPRFMNRIQSVTALQDRRSRWTALGPMGKPIRWEAEITSDQPNQSISWRSLPGSDVQVDGRVDFEPAPADRGTLISARVRYAPVSGMGSVAKFLNKGASFAMRQDLRRLEALLESGEIPTIEGQSHGSRDLLTGVFRAADPTRPSAQGSNLRDVMSARRNIA
jgi:uncharacterized membrane protein